MEIYLLGQFQVIYEGEILSALNHPRLQELLAYLCLHQGKPVLRQQIAIHFWPESNEDQARTNLRNLLHRLRKALPADIEFLIMGETHVQWNCEVPFTLDVVEFEGALRRAESAEKSARLEILAQAVNLYGGDLLPECYSEWLLAERERLRQAYLSNLSHLAELYEDQRDYLKSIQVVQDFLRLDTLNENAYAWLMRLHALNGNRGHALHVYHQCAEVLRRELNVNPGPILHSLYKQLLQTAALRLPSAPAAALISRQAEWEQLTRSWGELLRGEQLQYTTLISGEAGIGKTHLAQSFINWVQRQGYRTDTVTCYESSMDLAYAPVAAWLSGLYQQNGRLFDRLSPVWRLEISRLVPEMRRLDPRLGSPGSLSEKWQLLQFYEALLHSLSVMHGPLLLFLDDIHWCDPETLAWLAYLQTQPVGEKVMLLATARSEVLAGDPSLLQLFKKRDQNMLFELRPLDEAETCLLVEHLLGGPVDTALAQWVFSQSGGNPLFVTEMVRSGLDPFVNGVGHLPKGIQSVIDWRLNRLSAPARQMLELAAVIGRSFSYELLKSACELDEQTLVNCLDECWRQRILREQGSQAYDFSHDQLRQVVYNELSQARRRLWHKRVAQALERVFTANPAMVAEQIAHHLELAG